MTLAPPVDNPALQASWFHPHAFVNTRVGGLRRLDPTSAAVVAKLAGWVHGKPADLGPTYGQFTPGKPWINSTTNVYPSDDARRQPVTLTPVTWWLQTEQQPFLLNVPVSDATVGNMTDGNVVIVDTPRQTIWEFFKFARAADGALTAKAAGWISQHRSKEGVWEPMGSPPQSAIFAGSQWGVQASGFSQLAGLTTLAEIIQGCIPHATAFVVPWARKDWFSSPAQRTDGRDETTAGIPYGARFMLPTSFDADAYQVKRRTSGWDGAATEPTFTLGRLARTVINAWKAFGAIPVDQTGNGVGLLFESPPSCVARTGGACGPLYDLVTGSAGKGGALYDQQPDAIMRQLPWEALQLMPLDLRRRT